MYIPPNGLYFRLLGYVSQEVIFARNSDPKVGCVSYTSEHTDQYFTLIHGTGEHSGKYAIKSKATGYVLFSRRGSQPHVGLVPGDGSYNDK